MMQAAYFKDYCPACDELVDINNNCGYNCTVVKSMKRNGQMTREEAVNKLDQKYPWQDRWFLVNALEALGLLKFEDQKQSKLAPSTILMRALKREIPEVLDAIKALEKSKYKIIDADLYNIVDKRAKVSKPVQVLWSTEDRHYKDFGVLRLEEWPEGLVLWVGGVIQWKSWETYNR